MKNKALKLGFFCLIISSYCCKEEAAITEPMDEATWKLGWRMIENSWAENYELADLQFDSLLSLNKPISQPFLINGLATKMELSKDQEVLAIIKKQPAAIRRKICEGESVRDLKPCADLPAEKVENKKLELEIIEMFLNDQSVRGHLMEDLISKYKIDATKIIARGEIVVEEKYRERIKEIFWNYGFSNEELTIINEFIDKQQAEGSTIKDLVSKYELDAATFISPSTTVVDEKNRDRLAEIIQEFGFPTRKLIGKDAMRGVFLIIQHADGDRGWQKTQLANIELAANNGDLVKTNYAYLYDRIKVNAGEPQRYGSQFAKVDRKRKIAKLRETEDLANLDERRRAMEMMPIEMYRRLILKD